MKKKIKILVLTTVVIFTIICIIIVLTRLEKISELNNFKHNERNYTMLLNSYYSTYYRPPVNIGELKSYLDYLKRKTDEPNINNLIINDKMNIYYDEENNYLYLYHFGPDGKDQKLKIFIDVLEIEKRIFFSGDVIIGGITLFDICNDPLVMKFFYNGYPVDDSLGKTIASVLKPRVDSLQAQLISDDIFNSKKMILVKSKYIKSKWVTKLLCLSQVSDIQSFELENRINETISNLNLHQKVDSMYFPLFYQNKSFGN